MGIDALIREVVHHFQDEDAILATAVYPGRSKHAALHRELVDRATALAAQFRAGTLGIGESFECLAQDVLARHVQEADREYVRHLEGGLTIQLAAA